MPQSAKRTTARYRTASGSERDNERTLKRNPDQTAYQGCALTRSLSFAVL